MLLRALVHDDSLTADRFSRQLLWHREPAARLSGPPHPLSLGPPGSAWPPGSPQNVLPFTHSSRFAFWPYASPASQRPAISPGHPSDRRPLNPCGAAVQRPEGIAQRRYLRPVRRRAGASSRRRPPHRGSDGRRAGARDCQRGPGAAHGARALKASSCTSPSKMTYPALGCRACDGHSIGASNLLMPGAS